MQIRTIRECLRIKTQQDPKCQVISVTRDIYCIPQRSLLKRGSITLKHRGTANLAKCDFLKLDEIMEELNHEYNVKRKSLLYPCAFRIINQNSEKVCHI